MAWITCPCMVLRLVVSPVVIDMVNSCSRCAVAHVADGVSSLYCLAYRLPLSGSVELRLSWILWTFLCVNRAVGSTYQGGAGRIAAWMHGPHGAVLSAVYARIFTAASGNRMKSRTKAFKAMSQTGQTFRGMLPSAQMLNSSVAGFPHRAQGVVFRLVLMRPRLSGC